MSTTASGTAHWALLGLLAAFVVLIGACSPAAGDGEYLDAHRVEGIAVSNETAPCPFGDRCEAVFAVARSALLAREPGDRIVDQAFHDVATKRRDGLLEGRTIPFYVIVLTLADGSERAESFGCGTFGGLAGADSPEGFGPFCPQPATPRPTTTLVDLYGRGPLSWTQTLSAGRYGFRWLVTAAGSDCRIRLVLDGPTGSTALDDYGRVPEHASADGANFGTDLAAGTYSFRVATDCPGRSWLTVWRYLDAAG